MLATLPRILLALEKVLRPRKQIINICLVVALANSLVPLSLLDGTALSLLAPGLLLRVRGDNNVRILDYEVIVVAQIELKSLVCALR